MILRNRIHPLVPQPVQSSLGHCDFFAQHSPDKTAHIHAKWILRIDRLVVITSSATKQ